MIYHYCIIFLLFLIYSFIGYVIETISVSIIEKRLILSRGFLIGPYLPIFGVGALSLSCFLQKYQKDIIILFLMSAFICLTIEYFSSLLMEKIFQLRWWDYSEKKFNINGRVCLELGIYFGIGGVLAIKFGNPFFKRMLYSAPQTLIVLLGLFLSMVILLDYIVSFYIVFKFKNNIESYASKDSSLIAKKEILKKLDKNKFFNKRLLIAYPHILKNKNFRLWFEKLSKRVKK